MVENIAICVKLQANLYEITRLSHAKHMAISIILCGKLTEIVRKGARKGGVDAWKWLWKSIGSKFLFLFGELLKC